MRTSACVYNLNLERRRKMKNKNFLRVLAIVCVLVLCVGVLAACNKGSGGGSTGNQAGASMNAFVNTMFQSANEIANGTSFELADGKNIALSLGATITLKKDSGVAGEIMPIELALKGFLDRQNVTDKYIATANGAYVLSGNDVTIFTGTTELKEGEIRVTKEGNNYVVDKNGNCVAKFVPFDSANSAQAGYTRYSKAVALTSDNETYIDVSARINGVDSFRLIYEKDFLYATIAGNKVGVDLTKLDKTANGQTVKDELFTKIEGLLKNNVVKSVVEAFNGGDFDLNEVITGLINTFVKKEYMPYSDTLVNAASRNRYNLVNGEYVKDANGTYVVKTLADTIFEKDISFSGISINTMLSDIFGGKEKFYSYFGETLDVQGILTADLKGTPFASNLFSEPTWYTWKNGQFQEENKGYTSVKNDLSQKLSATVALNPFSLGESIAVTKNSAIKLGFEKEAGANGSIGKMSKFFLDLNLPAGTENRTFGIELAITDLKIGNSKDAISTTAVNKKDYGAMNIDAGLDFDFGEDLLSLVAHDYTSPDGLTFKVGGDDLTYDKETNTLTVPKTMKLNIKGTLDFVNIQNTRAVATITANDKVFAKLQLYSANIGTAENPDYDLQLDAKIMEEYKDVLPGILDMCVALGKNGGIGIYGFQQNEKGNWGFYDKKIEYVEATDGVYGKDAAGNYYLITDDKPVGADGKKYNQMVTYTTKEYVHFYYVESENGPYGVKTVKLKKDYYKLSSAELETYKGKRYDRYKANYSYEKLNNALDHFIKTGEAHVTGLNFVNIINNFIGGNDKNILMNFEKPATASADGDITIDDIIMSLVLKDNMGIIPAVYGLIGINQAAGLHNSLVIGGENLLATTFKNLFGYNNSDDDSDDDKGVYIDAVSMVALAIKYFTNYKVDLKGKTYDSVAVYKEFETELYQLTARGFYAKGLSKQLLLSRPAEYMTKGEEHFKNNPNATTEAMKQYGYAVVEDSDGNKYLYPYVLYAELELAAKKNDENSKTYIREEGFGLNEEGKLVLINTPDKLFKDIVEELNNPQDGTAYTESNYINKNTKAGSLLRQAYRLGKTYVPYFDKTANSWKVEKKAAAGTSANAEIIDDIALKVIIGTRKDGDRVTYGEAKVEGKVYGKTFSIKGYVNFEKTAPTVKIDDTLLKDENTKNNAFNITILTPEDGTIAN